MITYRKATVEDARSIATVQVKGWQTTYKGIVPNEFLERMSIDEQEEKIMLGLKNKERRQQFFVAENEEEVVGYIVGGESRFHEEYPDYDGELYAIYILKDYRGIGIGRSLVQLLVDWLQKNGFSQMIVWLLAENPAEYFYASLGAKYYDTQQLEIAGKQLDEYLYVWDKLEEFE